MNKLSLVKQNVVDIRKKLRKLIIKFNKGQFNIDILFTKLFNFVTTGEFTFEKILTICVSHTFLNPDLFSKYRFLFIINLDGVITAKNGRNLPEHKQEKVFIDVKIRLNYDSESYDMEKLFYKYMKQVRSEFNKNVKHSYNSQNEYFFNKIILKICLEPKGS